MRFSVLFWAADAQRYKTDAGNIGHAYRAFAGEVERCLGDVVCGLHIAAKLCEQTLWMETRRGL